MKISKKSYMGYSNGQLETSSGTGQGERGEPGLPGIGYSLDNDGNFDVDSKRLTDVADPVHDQYAATKKYVDDHISSGAASKKKVDDENAKQDIAINSKAEGDEVLLLDGSKSMMGNLQMGSKRITGLADGSDDGDAVNYSQLIDHTTDHKRDYQLASSFTFYRDFGDKGALTKSSLAISGHQHLDLYGVGAIEGRDTGFNGESWSSLRMTNTLGRGIYTVVFETFSSAIFEPVGPSNTNKVILNDETLLYSVHGDAHFQIITFNHDWESDSGGNTPHSKAYIQFSSGGQKGEIKFQIRYYGRSYNILALDLLFFSRVLRGNHTNTFDHQLFDVKESEYDNEFLFFEDLHLNNNKITNLAEPKKDGDAANKKYVDSQATNLHLADYLKRDGSQSMTGNLQMGDHTITGIRSSSQDNAALTNGGAKSLYLPLAGNKGMQDILNMSNNAIRYLKMPPSDPSSGNPPDDCALNFKYFHSQRGDLERQINEVGSKAFSIDGSDPMGFNLDMNGNNIIRLKDPLPSNSQYAASVNFVNKTISDSNANLSKIIDSKITEAEIFNIKSSTQNNAFLFVMDDDLFREDDDDITKVGEVEKDFYQIKKATYQFTFKYDSSIKYYSTRLSIDLISLPLGEYTLVFEMYYSGKTDGNQVTVSATSGSLTVSRTNTNIFGDHSRSIINFHKYIFSSGYEDLDIDIALKNRAGGSYDPNTIIYVIVYGVTGHQNEVSTLVWDSAFALEKKSFEIKG